MSDQLLLGDWQDRLLNLLQVVQGRVECRQDAWLSPVKVRARFFPAQALSKGTLWAARRSMWRRRVLYRHFQKSTWPIVCSSSTLACPSFVTIWSEGCILQSLTLCPYTSVSCNSNRTFLGDNLRLLLYSFPRTLAQWFYSTYTTKCGRFDELFSQMRSHLFWL